MARPLIQDKWGVWIHEHKPRKSYVRKANARYDALCENRAVIRKAFFKIRHDPNRREDVLHFAQCLGGKVDIVEADLEAARNILARTQPEKR